MLKKLREIITQCSFLLKFPRKTDLKRILGKKKSGSWSGANSEPCQISIMELKAVTYFDKKKHVWHGCSKYVSDDDCC